MSVDDEATPTPVMVHEGMTSAEANLLFVQHENQRLHLRIAELETDLAAAHLKSSRLALALRAARKPPGVKP